MVLVEGNSEGGDDSLDEELEKDLEDSDIPGKNMILELNNSGY